MNEQLADRSPRDVWDEMQSLLRLTEVEADTGRPKHLDLERHIWLLTLPSNIRILLDGAEDMEMEDLIRKAEALTVASRTTRASQNPILSVSTSDSHIADSSTSEANIGNEADHYAHDMPINSLERRRFHNRKSDSWRRNQPKGYITSSGLCNYHQKYGKNAWSCVVGCGWCSKNGQGGRRQ